MPKPNHSAEAAPSVLNLRLADEKATRALAENLAPLLKAGLVVWLQGDLGAGKTTLVRSLLRAHGYDGPVKSPTYSLVEVYVVSSLYWYHFDFYRFNEPGEFEDAGLGEYFRGDGLCIVEWPEKAAGHVPPADLVLAFRFAGASPASGRELCITAFSESGRTCLNELKASISSAVS